MPFSRAFLAAAFVAAMGPAADLQAQPETTMSQFEIAVACAPVPTLDVPSGQGLHIIGSQDPIPRAVYGTRDLLVINGGTAAGVQLGQQFYVRRANRFGLDQGGHGRGARTVGWIRIVAVNESTAIATFDHICAAVLQRDYLEPFVAPVIPAGADRDEATGEPDFTALGQVVAGNEDRSAMGAGDFVLIDRGSDQGVAPGSRVALYRNLGVAGMPLSSIGEAVVISTSATLALTRITRARDAVHNGDLVALRK